MKWDQLNLAREPFVNFRPIRRLTWILWVLAALLLVANTVLYWRHFSGQGQRRDLLEELEAAVDSTVTVCAAEDFGHIDDETCRNCTGYPECAARAIRAAVQKE